MMFSSSSSPLPKARKLSRILLYLILGQALNGSYAFLNGQSPLGPVQHVLQHTPAKHSPPCAKPSGPIETTSCDYETVESVTEQLFSRLTDLIHTPFFKYFKVDLYRECPFWQEDGFCMNRACGVTSMDESEVPEQWRAAALSQIRPPSEKQIVLPGCYSRDEDFCFLDDGEEGEFIDLSENPEGYTGYNGPSAHRVWSSIYDENCFGVSEASIATSVRYNQSPTSAPALAADSTEECMEKRVYYRIISGLHASISTHICYNDLDQATGQWGPNLQCFANRIAAHPERLQYIYFNTVLLLRAASRLGPYLSAYNLDRDQEPKTNELLDDVLKIAGSAGAFDETTMFRGSDAEILKEEFKDHFRNVSRIMDCVGCDKCRLWGKVQITGIGAALKILFEMDEKALDPRLNRNLLTRWEVVALFNALYRFTESLHATGEFRKMWHESANTEEIVAEAEVVASPPLRSSPSPVTSSEKIRISAFKPVHDLQHLFRTIFRVCRKGTVGCLNVVSRELIHVAQAVLSALRNIFALSGKDRGPGGEL